MKIVIPPDDSNVVSFTVRPLDETYRRADYRDRSDSCHHGPYVIDGRERTVTCERCKKVIDPIMCLLEIADQWKIYHKPRLAAIREYVAARKLAGEDFSAWWARVARGRSYPTKKEAANEAWIVASAPELKACDALPERSEP